MTSPRIPQAAIDWLDQAFPGWLDRVDVDRLNQNNALNCVLGQLAGSYWTVASRLPKDLQEVFGESHPSKTPEWRATIQVLRKQRAEQPTAEPKRYVIVDGQLRPPQEATTYALTDDQARTLNAFAVTYKITDDDLYELVKLVVYN